MPKPAFRLMIGESEFRAIGHVAAQWAYLETQIDAITYILCGQPLVQERGLRAQQSFKKRMGNLKEAASITLKDHEQIRSEILKIADEASSLRGLRDEIVHGCWRFVESRGNKEGMGRVKTGVDLINQYPLFRSSTKVITAEQAENLACKISELNLRLLMWSQAHVLSRGQNNG